MSKVQYFKNLRISTKFILWFLFVALVPLIIAISVSYSSSRKVLEEEVTNSLLAVADNKTNQIEAYLLEKKENAAVLLNMSNMIDAIEEFGAAFDMPGGVESPEYKAVEGKFSFFLTYYQKSFGYDDLFIIRPDGNIIFSVSKTEDIEPLSQFGRTEYSQLAKIFREIKRSLFTETVISDFEYCPISKKAMVFIAVPIFEGGDLSGVVAFQMSNEGVSKLVQDYTGLGNTGETIIFSKVNDEVVSMVPIRFDPEAAFKRKIDISSLEGLDMREAIESKVGSSISVDYRGHQVLKVWRYLPTFRWGMVIKMDMSEVFASAGKLRDTLLIISLALLILVVIMAILIAQSVAHPIKELIKTSGVIAGGDLTARAVVNAEDEVGALAKSFNQMTNRLVEAKDNVEKQKTELEKQKKMLQKVNYELDSFVYTASHDLRAPLRGITSFSKFLEEDYGEKFDDQGKDYLKEIIRGTNRMSMLIDDLLTLSRISRIKNPFKYVEVDKLIQSVIERIEFDIKEYKVDLKIQQNLPTMRCDHIKIAELFLNLINNAIKFSSKNNKENPIIEVGYRDKNKFHEFFVRDNGIGIDPKYHTQIFGIFKRLHSDKEYAGTGAGLTIVKRIVDDHDGQIWIESEVGKGATFYFLIPKVLKGEKKKIGEILVEDGLITDDELKQSLDKQDDKKKKLPEYHGEL
jgi:signal transduction histidine kinase